MGGLLGEGLAVTDGETIDLYVQLSLRNVIKGYLDPLRTSDGPFAEFTNFYGPHKEQMGLMHVTAELFGERMLFIMIWTPLIRSTICERSSLESCVYDSVKRLVPGVTRSRFQ